MSLVKSTTPVITLVIWAAIVMAAVTITAVVILAIVRPADTTTITVITGISAPIILMLMALGQQGIHKLVNSTSAETRSALVSAQRENAMLRERVGTDTSILPVLLATRALMHKHDVDEREFWEILRANMPPPANRP